MPKVVPQAHRQYRSNIPKASFEYPQVPRPLVFRGAPRKTSGASLLPMVGREHRDGRYDGQRQDVWDGLVGILGLIVIGLVIAAVVKYLFFR